MHVCGVCMCVCVAMCIYFSRNTKRQELRVGFVRHCTYAC